MAKSNITNNIRTLRFLHDEMTQKDLADKVGVTRQTILALEKDRYSPSLDLAFKIACVFGVGIDDVFTYEDDNT